MNLPSESIEVPATNGRPSILPATFGSYCRNGLTGELVEAFGRLNFTCPSTLTVTGERTTNAAGCWPASNCKLNPVQ